MKLFLIHIFLFTLLLTAGTYAQDIAIPVPLDCYVSEYKGATAFRKKIDTRSFRQPPGSQIEAEYIDFPNDAQLAFDLAIEIWESYIVSTIPIKIKATWSGDLADNTLAQSSASRVVRNFSNAPYSEVWYAIPLAEALASRDINNGDSDINIAMNRRINWYTGLEGKPRGSEYDLVSIALHEIAHGLGFSSSFKVTDNGLGTWGQSNLPYVYDLFVQTSSEQRLVNSGVISNPSAALLQLMESNELFFDIFDPVLGLELPKLQSLSPFTIGRSISHLDERSYPNGDENSLMTPNIGPGELIRDPGIRALSVLEQIGWTIKNISSERPLAQENSNQKVLIFPVPTKENLSIYTPSDWQGSQLSLKVYDISGKAVLQKEISLDNTTFQLELDQLVPGIYFLSGNRADQKFSKRFIKL